MVQSGDIPCQKQTIIKAGNLRFQRMLASVKINKTNQLGTSIVERTLIILKPDALQRNLIGEILGRLERKGLKIIGLKMLELDEAVLKAHYAHIVDKPFYKDVESFMQSSPVVVIALEGYEAVSSVRLIVGATNPREADAGTIRGDLAIGNGRNLIHASDTPKNGQEEVARFFRPAEIFIYKKADLPQIYAPGERN